MERATHSLADLFRQLGLSDDPNAIEAFIARHGPMARGLSFADAPFWSAAQREFLYSATSDDADWAEVVDELSARMH